MSSCQICGAERIDYLLTWEEYSINRCRSCELIFSSPTPSDGALLQYYQGFMFRPPDDQLIERDTRIKKRELVKLFGLEISKNRLREKRFLDYGGGTGIAYNAAIGLGLDAYYQDLDQESICFVKNKFGLLDNKLVKDLGDVSLRFDFIFSDNVIEHVPIPENFVRQLLEKLSVGGVLVLKTPHAGNTEVIFNPVVLLKEYFFRAWRHNSIRVAVRSCFSGYWHCAPPRHLFSFSAKSLELLAEKLGVPCDAYELMYYQSAFLSNTLTEHLFISRNKPKGFKGFVLRVLALPFAFIEIVLQVISRVLVVCGIASSGGIIMKITKEHDCWGSK